MSADTGCAAADVWLLVDEPASDDAALLAACETLLGASERRRLATFHAPLRRREFLLGHALARLALTHRRAHVAPREWQLGVGGEGRPQARAAHTGAPALSIAHTRGLLLAAVADDGEVGVDVEWCGRRPRALALAERFFAAPEVADIRARPAAAQAERFLAFWTMKEAYLKARGVGLRLPLRDIAFRLPEGAASAWRAPDESPATAPVITVELAASLQDQPSRWLFRQWAHAGGHLVGFAHGAPAPAPVSDSPRLHELDTTALLDALTSR